MMVAGCENPGHHSGGAAAYDQNFTHGIFLPVSLSYDIRVKSQKVVNACMIRLLNLRPAKHEKVAIYAVNQRISNV